MEINLDLQLIRFIIDQKFGMKALIYLLIVALITVTYTQEAASIEAPITDNPVNITQDVHQKGSEVNQQQVTKQPQQLQSIQTPNIQGQDSKIQATGVNSTQNQQSQVKPQSIPPQQYHPPPQNKEKQDSSSQSSNPSPNKPIQQSVQSSQEDFDSAFHGLSAQQQQQLLNQQKLLQQYGNSDGHGQFWKYANYTKQQLLQLQKKWQEQVRIAHQSAINQIQQRQRTQRQQLKKLMAQQKLTKSQEINHKQNFQFMERQGQFNKINKNHHFNDYMFQLGEAESQDFEINLVSAQAIALYASTYINIDGVYSRATEVEDDEPPQIQVLEQGKVSIANQQFYFKKYLYFQGKVNTKYLIRVNNPGKDRLFSLSLVQIVEQSQVSHALTGEDFLTYGPRAAKIYDQIKQQMDHNSGLTMLSVSNDKILNASITKYFNYNLLELLAVIAACVIQIKFIEKLLSTSSIV